MNDAYRSDEEQVENLKKWWKENGTSTIVSIALAMSAVLGWQAWQKHKVAQVENASVMFEDLVKNVQNPNMTDEQRASANHIAKQLKTEYGSSSYAQYASLFQAKMAMEDKDYDKAAELLSSVAANAKSEQIQHIANARLVRLYLQQEKLDEAFSLVNVGAKGFEAYNYELLGDVLKAQGKTGEASEAYKMAKSFNEKAQQPVNNFMLDLKAQQLASELGAAE